MKASYSLHLLAFVGIGDEDGDVDDFHEGTCRVDGDDEEAMGVDNGEAIEDPEHAIEKSRDVRHPRVALG